MLKGILFEKPSEEKKNLSQLDQKRIYNVEERKKKKGKRAEERNKPYSIRATGCPQIFKSK